MDVHYRKVLDWIRQNWTKSTQCPICNSDKWGIGPEIVERIRFALPDEIFTEDNKGLINWFHTVLYQIPAKEFLELIGLAISEDESKVKNATSRFKEIMREAQQLKSEYDEYKQEEGGNIDDNPSDDDDDDMDDFFASLGIVRPK